MENELFMGQIYKNKILSVFTMVDAYLVTQILLFIFYRLAFSNERLFYCPNGA